MQFTRPRLAPKSDCSINASGYYDLARVYSLKNEHKLAVESLQKAIDLDKSKIEFSKTDPDLDNIRQTPEFQQLIDSYWLL